MTQDGRARKPRHRRRATAAAGPPQPVAAPEPPKAAPPAVAKPGDKRRDNGGERGLRDLAGAGASQVGVSRALRARDVNRPSTDDLAEAEAALQLVRRNWRPQS